jgi:cyclopropane-fatty-acyl-phospholipid synthase
MSAMTTLQSFGAGDHRPSETMPRSLAGTLIDLIERQTGGPIPVAVRAWDGSVAGPDDAVLTITLARARALRWLLWSPGELGAARAYVAGDLDFDGDLLEALSHPRMIEAATRARGHGGRNLAGWLRLVGLARRNAVLGAALAAPADEIRLRGRLHSRRRDAAAIRHHYDVGDAFYRLILGSSMVYSCGFWSADPSEEYTVDDAQRDKLDLVCGKLGLSPGQRLLDVGCGWGGLVVHAASHYGVQAVGVTVSAGQVAVARERAAAAGVADLVEIRLQDYRDVNDRSFDAIASVGMAEHLGAQQYPQYCDRVLRLLRPGGRLLHHQITAADPASASQRRHGFIGRYVFPDGELRPLGQVVGALEHAGLEVCDVEGLREHYLLTLTAWEANLTAQWSNACRASTPTKARIWRLYLLGSAAAFATGRISVHQVLACRPAGDGRPVLSRLRSTWMPGVQPSWPASEPAGQALCTRRTFR